MQWPRILPVIKIHVKAEFDIQNTCSVPSMQIFMIDGGRYREVCWKIVATRPLILMKRTGVAMP